MLEVNAIGFKMTNNFIALSVKMKQKKILCQSKCRLYDYLLLKIELTFIIFKTGIIEKVIKLTRSGVNQEV